MQINDTQKGALINSNIIRFARWPKMAVVFSPGLVFASFLVFGWLLKPDCSSSDS